MALFTNYRVFHFSQGSPLARIECYDKEKYIGCMEFYPDDITLPANKTKDGIMYVRYPIRDLTDIMNTLRYEKPLFLNQQGAVGYVGTASYEEIGEQEV